VRMQKLLAKRRVSRLNRVRNRVRGTAARPRISVQRSHLHFWLQLIDDETGRTLCAASSKALELPKGGNVAAAKAVGAELGRKATALGIKAASFDRGAYRYHGRIKAAADAIRAAGIAF
jgi:large subunit ribosomal protein L18